MNQMQSPGAVAAHGASEIDELGPRVVSKSSPHQGFPQVPIRGADYRVAEGASVFGHAPLVLALCRAPVEAQHDPQRALRAHRGGVLALVVRPFGEGAQPAVKDNRHRRTRRGVDGVAAGRAAWAHIAQADQPGSIPKGRRLRPPDHEREASVAMTRHG
jgi:hypothetical protein